MWYTSHATRRVWTCICQGSVIVFYYNKLKKGVHQMDTLNRVRAEQQARYAVQHEQAMAKSPWIRESVQAYRNATPEQIAEVEAYRKRVYGW